MKLSELVTSVDFHDSTIQWIKHNEVTRILQLQVALSNLPQNKYQEDDLVQQAGTVIIDNVDFVGLESRIDIEWNSVDLNWEVLDTSVNVSLAQGQPEFEELRYAVLIETARIPRDVYTFLIRGQNAYWNPFSLLC